MNSCVSRGSADRGLTRLCGFGSMCLSFSFWGQHRSLGIFFSDGNGDRYKMAKQKDLRPLGPQAWNCYPITSTSFCWPKQVTCQNKIKVWENMSPFQAAEGHSNMAKTVVLEKNWGHYDIYYNLYLRSLSSLIKIIVYFQLKCYVVCLRH